MDVLLLDNHDSFTYLLAGYLERLGARCDVVASDSLSTEEALARVRDAAVLSPGPGTPREAGICMEFLASAGGRFPVLGVCLGHQAMAEHLGGRVVGADRRLHGMASEIFHDGKGIFANLGQPFVAARYHSLIVDAKQIPRECEVSAWTSSGEVMGLRCDALRWDGVQFHPESVLTEEGLVLLSNWLKAATGTA